MKFIFHPEAEEEFEKTIEYYEKIQPGLGYDFAIEVYLTIQRITSFPGAWPIIEDNIRRCLINRFPYGILYDFEKETIYILAVMHLHREPDYWKKRK